MLRNIRNSLFALGVCAVSACAADGVSAVDTLLDRIVQQEQDLVEQLRAKSAVVETYIQEMGDTPGISELSIRDHYFLGRLDLAKGLNYVPLAARSETKGARLSFLRKTPAVFVPGGFAQMVMPDRDGFNRQNYQLEYVRREFLGEVRCLVFDVSPRDKKAIGRFIGRLWAEDRDFHIVRFNGTYTGSTPARLFFHFDSWRVNVQPGQWVPAAIYVEEAQPLEKNQRYPRFKAQTRLWGYNVTKSGRLDELASIAVDAEKAVSDTSTNGEASPLESQRSWERQAEANILERLDKSGLLALPGSVDEVLNTVVNNLIVSNNLNVEAKCRVLLTTPLETFSVGQTIVISRGLIDVLPDEASLAMVLAGELAHIALGHRNDTHFAFSDRTMLNDEELLNRFRQERPAEQLASARQKAFEMLSQSPYKDKMANAGLFLKALASRAPQFPNLIHANIGNQLASTEGLMRIGSLVGGSPALDDAKLDQIAALPLGSRIHLDPWTNQIALLKAKPVSLLSARDKLPFEITPFLLPLARVDARLDAKAGN
jgi:hypothetical protein